MKIRIVLPNKKSESKYPDTIDIPINEINKVENGTCTEIYLKRILEYIEKPYVLIEHCEKKLRKGGKIHIESVDMIEIARGYYMGILSRDELNDMILDTKFLHAIHDTIQWLKKKFTIDTKGIDNYIYYIEGTYHV